MSFTFIIIIITIFISIAAFNNDALMNMLILWPKQMHSPAEYYRLVTSGFIHNDWNHLIFNMLALYFFGANAEMIFGEFGLGFLFVVLYLTGIIVASMPSFLKNRNNSYYRSLGASGGVSAIVFFTIYYFPWSRVGIIFIPFIQIPAIIFAVLYLVYSAFMSKGGTGSMWGGGNINHDAHIWGSVYGFVFALIIDPTHGSSFLEQITHPH
jgi:membrane associated rhomboid family serine protease